MADTLTNPMHVEVISPDGPIYRETGVEMVLSLIHISEPTRPY
mgnify:CR=1 FL=1